MSEPAVEGFSGPPGARSGPAVPRVLAERARDLADGKLQATGKVGDTVSAEEAASLARLCALNGLAAAASVAGGLDAIRRIVKVTGFVASAPSFTGQPAVVNGASEFFIEVFGEAGRHARSAVGMAVLPLDTPVEVELIVEVA